MTHNTLPAVTPVQELVKLLKATDVKKTEIEQSLKDIVFLRDAHLQSLIARLESGETTGDRYDDMVIRTHRVIDTKSLAAKYHELEARLSGHSGELMLIEYIGEVEDGMRRSDQDHKYISKRLFRLGVLSGEMLTWEKVHFSAMAYTFPVSQYLMEVVGKYHRRGLDQALSVCKNNILACQYHSHYGMESNPSPLPHHIADKGNIERIVIGDEEVLKWCKENREEGFYDRAAEALGKLVLTPE